MGAKGNTYINDWLKLLFNATAIADIADNAGTTPLTDLYVALHTADPGAAGSQSTSEISYTGYARIAVARSGSGWVVTGQSVSPAASIDFGTMTAGAGGTVTHISVGTDVSGAGKLLYRGTLSPNLTVVNGVTPRLTTSSVVTEA